MTQQQDLLPVNITPSEQALPAAAEGLGPTDLQRIRQSLDSSVTENTRASYRSAWKDFERWAQARATLAMPASPALIAAYLSHLAEDRRLSVATVRLHLAALAAIHKAAGHPDPTDNESVRQIMKGIARRHRLAEWLVVELLDMDLQYAHIEAHRLEHGISGDLEAKLRERLGYPEKSPFGRPIPGAGSPPLPSSCITLDMATKGIEYLVERIPEEDSNLLKFLDDAQIVPASIVSVAEATPYLGVMTVSTPMDQVSMGFNVAQQILVRPAQSPTNSQSI